MQHYRKRLTTHNAFWGPTNAGSLKSGFRIVGRSLIDPTGMPEENGRAFLGPSATDPSEVDRAHMPKSFAGTSRVLI